jgi:magnesium-transporting ATPase (P-type)
MKPVTRKSIVTPPPSKPATGKAPEIASATLPDTLELLHVNSETGLTHGQVETSRKEHGYNEVAEQKVHPLLNFLKKFWGLSAWMLESIMLLSIVLGHYSDLVIISVLLVINAVQRFAQERRAAGVMESLRRRLQVTASVLRDKNWKVIPSRELVPGDIVRVRPGDLIPADVKVLTGTLSVDQSVLTGESKDIDKAPGEVFSSGSVVRAYALNSTGIIGTTLVWDKCAKPKISSTGRNRPIFTEESHVAAPIHHQEILSQITRSPHPRP